MKQFLKQKLNGRSQRWLCEKTGINEVDFSNSINGIHRQFRFVEWEKIVDVLELTPEDLAHPDVESYPFVDKPPRQPRSTFPTPTP